MTNTCSIYLHLDGDGIGDRVELHLLDEDTASASEFSESVTQAMNKARKHLESIVGTEIILAGGDDLVAKIDQAAWDTKELELLRENFRKGTGCTLSGGSGRSTSEALINLRRAKLSGKNALVVGG